jgi:hypothetical protein
MPNRRALSGPLLGVATTVAVVACTGGASPSGVEAVQDAAAPPDASADARGGDDVASGPDVAAVDAGDGSAGDVFVGGRSAADGASGRSIPPADAATDVDDGAPSSPYPAPHPPLPVLTNAAGGPVLTAPSVHFIFYPGMADAAALQTFAQRLASSSYWPTVTREYGVGALSYAGTTVLTGQTAPKTIASADLQTWIGQTLQSGALGTPDPQVIYTVVFPSTTTITQPNPVLPGILQALQSCVDFRGFHDDVVITPDGGSPTSFAYAVIATCSTSVDDVTAVSSHEWVEASTDPQVSANGTFTLSGGPHAAYFSVDTNHIVWDIWSDGGEAGDLCQPEGAAQRVTPPDVGNAVQRTWSNQLAAASHDPCAPDPAGVPFFSSAPVLDETVTFTSALTGRITTQGVTIPVGQSRTIEIDLFSDAPTSGPWTVSAEDVFSTKFGGFGLQKTLSFQWDRTQGTNGDKLHLTITVMGAMPLIGGAHAFVIHSTLGNRTHSWPGLVVE